MKRIQPTIHLSILMAMAFATTSRNLHAKEPASRNIDVHITTGVRALPTLPIFGFLPLPPSAAVAVDVNHFRVRTDLSYHPGVNGFHGTVGAGYLFWPTGKDAATKGGFQLKLPLLFDAGVLKCNTEVDDGYTDHITWLLLGPSTSADLTWWKANKLGFTISLKAGYQFRIDVDSNYSHGIYSARDTIGVADFAVLFGVAI